MSRAARHLAIVDIVTSEMVRSQQELVERLAERGLSATQTTVSRDIRDLGLVKRSLPSGEVRYATADADLQSSGPDLASLRRAFRSVASIEEASALLVLRTPSGFANRVAVEIDGQRVDGVVGTLAGDDTILIILRGPDDAKRVQDLFSDLMAS